LQYGTEDPAFVVVSLKFDATRPAARTIHVGAVYRSPGPLKISPFSLQQRYRDSYLFDSSLRMTCKGWKHFLSHTD